jgi:hypothetical protein
MKPRLVFAAIVIAFLVWVLLALLTDAAGTADTTPTDSTGTTTDEVSQLQAQLSDTQQQLQSVQRARIRERRGFRRRLAYVIHDPALGGHWLERAFGCIHVGEGSWTDATGNGYFGGLQMDIGFQRTYGAWALAAFGTANRWPMSVQVATAIRAYMAGRRFQPWPNTARACGLTR